MLKNGWKTQIPSSPVRVVPGPDFDSVKVQLIFKKMDTATAYHVPQNDGTFNHFLFLFPCHGSDQFVTVRILTDKDKQ